MGVAKLVVHDGEWFAPVALTREQPVAQAICGGGFAHAIGCKPFVHASLCFSDRRQAIEADRIICRVDVFAIARKGFGPCTASTAWCNAVLFEPCSRWHRCCSDRQVVRACKFKVALIAAWHRHDGASAVPHEYVVSDVDRYFTAADRVHCH